MVRNIVKIPRSQIILKNRGSYTTFRTDEKVLEILNGRNIFIDIVGLEKPIILKVKKAYLDDRYCLGWGKFTQK